MGPKVSQALSLDARRRGGGRERVSECAHGLERGEEEEEKEEREE